MFTLASSVSPSGPLAFRLYTDLLSTGDWKSHLTKAHRSGHSGTPADDFPLLTYPPLSPGGPRDTDPTSRVRNGGTQDPPVFWFLITEPGVVDPGPTYRHPGSGVLVLGPWNGGLFRTRPPVVRSRD